ncbi:hypothetical protein LQZ19_05070 [Treponema primitia]|uniref:hypothetical protein n=1 Tax=Treponema primitia TaxID=88058 RepID=UPI00398168EF
MTDQSYYSRAIKDKKSLQKVALPRIYFIDREIASGKYPSTAFLAKEYATSMSTIWEAQVKLMMNMARIGKKVDP